MMKPLIFLVEDDEVLIKNFKIFFEMNDYDLATALNGKQGLDVLSNLESPPDIIISDILMPEMDGYEFYMKVSEKTEWSRIPFFFLSGKTEPDDVRFGKMLGADDYITKPFSPKDLLEKIKIKIKESREIRKSSKILEEKLKDILKFEEPSLETLSRADFYYIFQMSWDDNKGPVILDYFPKNLIPSLNLENLTTQLYSTLIKIYEFEQVLEKNQFIMRIVKDLIDAYALIDKMEDSSVIAPKSGKGTFMVCAITPNFHYLNSKRIRGLLTKIAFNIKAKKEWNIKEYWEQLSQIV
ncbi:MAG: response regulator [Candidatus Lokiarchaeota archaeon]|nr:response regulator [Candidatus Lokiarchaeota archaeon]